ncbi:hypothetical protein [Photobacterium damselae]|uniref:hypothetical protein n=1 Tax=Photobacterium damselae TaxID=38293 RepID=UPI001EFCC4A6|nr:hypothetical protein [Photobacterium damselae]MCG9780593.1 hypothetical protein [Photobacterium damselae]
MSQKRSLTFYKPSGNHYHSPVDLWCIGRIDSRESSLPWLETYWIGTQGQTGLGLFLSKLDAQIQCIYMNASEISVQGKGQWSVYSFSDLNREEMVKNMKFNYGKDIFGFSLIFGFSATPNEFIISGNQALKVLSFHEGYLLDDFLLSGSDDILVFSQDTFKQISDIWGSIFNDYFLLTNESNSINKKELLNLSINAFKTLNYIPIDKTENEYKDITYVGGYSLFSGWNFTSFHNPIPAELR